MRLRIGHSIDTEIGAVDLSAIKALAMQQGLLAVVLDVIELNTGNKK